MESRACSGGNVEIPLGERRDPLWVQSRDSRLTLPISQAVVDGPAEVAHLIIYRLRHHHFVPVLEYIFMGGRCVCLMFFWGGGGGRGGSYSATIFRFKLNKRYCTSRYLGVGKQDGIDFNPNRYLRLKCQKIYALLAKD